MTASRIIRLGKNGPQIVHDHWVVVREMGEGSPAPSTSEIIPLPAFLALSEEDAVRVRAVWISPDDDFEPEIHRLVNLDMLAVDFPVFRDGRGYSIAKLLRTRYGWTGELRAVGDVLRDQLNYMRRCGFDAFAVRADKDIEDAIKSFSFYSVTYQAGVDEPEPLFRRRQDS